MRFTSPFVARTLSASRTGLRLTLNSRQSASSVNRYSGGYCQEITRSLSVATIDPLSDGLVGAIAFNSPVVACRRAGDPCMPMDSAIAVPRDNEPAHRAADIGGLAVKRVVGPILCRGCRNLNRRETRRRLPWRLW